jgi:hypothetical protein
VQPARREGIADDMITRHRDGSMATFRAAAGCGAKARLDTATVSQRSSLSIAGMSRLRMQAWQQEFPATRA